MPIVPQAMRMHSRTVRRECQKEGSSLLCVCQGYNMSSACFIPCCSFLEPALPPGGCGKCHLSRQRCGCTAEQSAGSAKKKGAFCCEAARGTT